MFGDASGSRGKKTTHLLNCQRPAPRKPGAHVYSTLAFASSAREEKQGRPASFGREEQAQAEMRGVAQTQRPRHVAVELQAKRPRRPIGPVVARLAADATELQRAERAGAAHVFQNSIGGRGGARQGRLTMEPALAFFVQDALRKLRPAADAVTVGRVFPPAALLGVSRDDKRRGRLPDAGGTKQGRRVRVPEVRPSRRARRGSVGLAPRGGHRRHRAPTKQRTIRVRVGVNCRRAPPLRRHGSSSAGGSAAGRPVLRPLLLSTSQAIRKGDYACRWKTMRAAADLRMTTPLFGHGGDAVENRDCPLVPLSKNQASRFSRQTTAMAVVKFGVLPTRILCRRNAANTPRSRIARASISFAFAWRAGSPRIDAIASLVSG